MQKSTIGKILLLSATMIWGLAFVMVQYALDGGWSTFALLSARGFLGALLFSAISFSQKWWKNKKLVLSSLGAGFILFVSYVCQTYGQYYSSVSNAAFITVLYVVLVPVFGSFIHHTKIKRRVYLSVILAVVGTFILNYQGEFRLYTGDILLLGCATLFAVHILIMDRMQVYDSVAVTAIQLWVMGICGFIGMLLMGEWYASQAVLPVFFCAFMASGVAFFFQAYAQKSVDSSTTSLILTLEAVFGVLSSVLILHEAVTANMLIGGGMLLFAVIYVQLG
ncbi:MAG: DMT family transporter [Erysipelotrichaceae bacterium]|jgi:drug/metabolite transporter (DMT)-like permease|nr:DMT family transporter [Erysipelotrichaceae bacterium]